MNFSKNVKIEDYPIKPSDINEANSNGVSMFLPTNPRVIVKPSDMVKPPEVGSHQFWSEVMETVWATYLAKQNCAFNSKFAQDWDSLQPKGLIEGKRYTSDVIFRNYRVRNAAQGAGLVRADFPTDIITGLAKYLYGKGVKQRELLAKTPYSKFTDNQVMLGHLIGWAVHTVSPNAFAAKWYFGQPRPEEVIGAWAREEIEAPIHIDQQLRQLVNIDQVLSDQRKFTMYPEGSPNHPSMPAMHGAAGGIAILFGLFFELDELMLDQVRRTAANIAFFRNFAGVHYRTDSVAGLNLGEVVLQKALPAKLAEYGADIEETQEIIDGLMTNWS